METIWQNEPKMKIIPYQFRISDNYLPPFLANTRTVPAQLIPSATEPTQRSIEEESPRATNEQIFRLFLPMTQTRPTQKDDFTFSRSRVVES